MHKCALAIFVKTPGHSPIKTRLARDIGSDAALALYVKSVDATEESALCAAREFSPLHPIWAVAEVAGMSDPLWENFERIIQGSGDLGERLSTVYAALKRDFRSVILIGADSPQVEPDLFIDAAKLLVSDSEDRIVVGPARDGGFFLFGSNVEFEKAFWTGIPYSSPETLSELLKRVPPEIEVTMLPSRCDLDTKSDIGVIHNELLKSTRMTASQKQFFESLTEYLTFDQT